MTIKKNREELSLTKTLDTSVIPTYYKQRDAADYLEKSEAQLVQLTREKLMKYAVLFSTGEIIYSIDELDKWGKFFLTVDEIEDQETKN